MHTVFEWNCALLESPEIQESMKEAREGHCSMLHYLSKGSLAYSFQQAKVLDGRQCSSARYSGWYVRGLIATRSFRKPSAGAVPFQLASTQQVIHVFSILICRSHRHTIVSPAAATGQAAQHPFRSKLARPVVPVQCKLAVWGWS